MLHRTLVASVVLALAALASASSTPEVPPVPPVIQATDAEVKTLTQDLEKAVGEKNDELLAKAMERLESLRHDSFVPYIRNGMKSASPAVVAAAYRGAATYEIKDFEKEARKLLHQKAPKKSDKDPTGLAGEVGSAAIDYLGRLGFSGEETTVVDDFLVPFLAFGNDDKRVSASWAKDLLRSTVHYLGRFKSKHAVATLIDLVGEPKRKPWNDPNRPDPNPAEPYWRARSQLWAASESWVRWALKEITGQEFRSPRDWEAWFKLNKKDYR